MSNRAAVLERRRNLATASKAGRTRRRSQEGLAGPEDTEPAATDAGGAADSDEATHEQGDADSSERGDNGRPSRVRRKPDSQRVQQAKEELMAKLQARTKRMKKDEL